MKTFTHLYSTSKTLKFELIPQGKTLETIEKNGLLIQDENRAISYKKMKKTIDEFHKWFIELSLKNVKLNKLEEYYKLYTSNADLKKEDSFKKEYDLIKNDLRKEIVNSFNDGEAKEIYEKLFQKELITEVLEQWTNSQENLYFDDGFKKFTTYFIGFYENRKNMYSNESKSTAIAFRLIHENLPKFIDNLLTFEKIKANNNAFNFISSKIKSAIEPQLDGISIEDMFELNYFNSCLTQSQIDFYNLMIGGKTELESELKTQGINELINLYNQTQKNKKDRVPKMKMLYKQILSDKISFSLLPDKFENDESLIQSINSFYQINLMSFKDEINNTSHNLIEKIRELFMDLNSFDLTKIYLKNDTSLCSISQKTFGDYSFINQALDYYYLTIIDPEFSFKIANSNEKKQEVLYKQKNKYTKQEYFSLADIQNIIAYYLQSFDDDDLIKTKHNNHCIVNYFAQSFFSKQTKDTDKEFDFNSNIIAKYQCIQGLLNVSNKTIDLKQDQKTIDDIKLFLDAIQELLHFIKPLNLKSDIISDKDDNFYDVFEKYYEELNLLTPLYNKVRNYLTQKPYSQEKIKLNFQNAQLLNGWDANKEVDYLTVLLRKNNLYYLAIMDKKHNKSFNKFPTSNNNFEKMNYKLIPGVNKMLPKVFFSKKNIDFFAPSSELLTNYKNNTHKKGDNFSLNDCHTLIDFFKNSLNKHEDWKGFNFKFSDTNSYNDLSGFYREVEHQSYKVSFEPISTDYINELVNDGKLYLFQIYNKDFSKHSNGTPNLHTIYWKALFEEDNIKNVIYKLNGQAEIFYRKKSIKSENTITHKAKQSINAKNPLTPKAINNFEYDIIKDKRYTIDKFHFHVPITLNFKATGNNIINQQVMEHLKNNPDVNIIGLDRGERHLVYLTLINQKGEILLQESLNEIKSEKFNITTPYQKLLDKREKERDEARKNWSSIENIKNLKEGYISQAVNKITKLMVEHNAIVVMEDLNFGFKRGRFKVEKQVYQKLEKMLIDKLNYLVIKDIDKKEPNALGGRYNALQLANKFESFQKLGKQCGFIFYVPAWNTSKIDPVTGFVNLFSLKYENLKSAKAFIQNFDTIKYNPISKLFEFTFDYNNFTEKAKETKSKWTVCTHGERILTYRNSEKNNEWDNKTIVIQNEFEAFFEKHNIDWKNQDLIEAMSMQEEKAFFEKFYSLFKLCLQMRNSITNSDVDYLISPVSYKSNNVFFDSREQIKTLPLDADANGAYNIARKGLWVIQQINNSEDLKKTNLTISNKQWLQFVQK
jgi:CRISPR-associated protein Cpf1